MVHTWLRHICVHTSYRPHAIVVESANVRDRRLGLYDLGSTWNYLLPIVICYCHHLLERNKKSHWEFDAQSLST